MALLPTLDSILDRYGGAIWSKYKGYTLLENRNEFVTVTDSAAYFVNSKNRPVRSYMVWTPTGATTSSKLVFHVTMEAQHQFDSTVTEYPVEDGVNISDHIAHKNPTFSVKAMFSDASLKLVSDQKGGGILNQQDSYNLLLSLRNSKQLVTLRTPLGSYDDLAITNISLPKTAAEGRSLFVDLSFQQIRKINTATTTVDVTIKKDVNKSKASGKTVKDSCAPKTDEGAKPPQPVEDELAAQLSAGIQFMRDQLKVTGVSP